MRKTFIPLPLAILPELPGAPMPSSPQGCVSPFIAFTTICAGNHSFTVTDENPDSETGLLHQSPAGSSCPAFYNL